MRLKSNRILYFSTSLVPVISFGETDLLNQIYCPEGSTFRRIQNYIRNLIGLVPIVFWGRGFFQNSFGIIPRNIPVSVVGKILFMYLRFYILIYF